MKQKNRVSLWNVFFMIGAIFILAGCPQGQGKTDSMKDTIKNADNGAGTIVLKDGTFVEKDSYTEIDNTNPPIAVLIGVKNAQGKHLGIGLHTKGRLQWAKNGSPGYKTNFTGIICTPSKTESGAAETATFTGDTDGGDNWEYICQMDAEGTAHAEENYPAFHWVNEYARTYKTGEQKWYMPSLAELCEVYKNREVINASLAKIHGLNNDAADNGLGTSYYWSSSQRASLNNFAWLVYFNYGNVGFDYKDNKLRVCCLSGF